MRLFFLLAVMALIMDLATKWAAFQRLESGVVHRVIPGTLNFVLSENPGAVFGLGKGLRPVFIGFTLVASGAIVWAQWAHGRASRSLTVGLGLLLGGALGNLYDRVVLGHVRDFIDFYVGSWHWHTFNVADAAICTGCGLILLYSFTQARE